MLLTWLARNWRIGLIFGGLAVLLGIGVFKWPGLAVAVLILLSGLYVIFHGLTAIAYGLLLHRRCYIPLDSCKRVLRIREQR